MKYLISIEGRSAQAKFAKAVYVCLLQYVSFLNKEKKKAENPFAKEEEGKSLKEFESIAKAYLDSNIAHKFYEVIVVPPKTGELWYTKRGRPVAKDKDSPKMVVVQYKAPHMKKPSIVLSVFEAQ